MAIVFFWKITTPLSNKTTGVGLYPKKPSALILLADTPFLDPFRPYDLSARKYKILAKEM